MYCSAGGRAAIGGGGRRGGSGCPKDCVRTLVSFLYVLQGFGSCKGTNEQNPCGIFRIEVKKSEVNGVVVQYKTNPMI